jgi:hypothetical protein
VADPNALFSDEPQNYSRHPRCVRMNKKCPMHSAHACERGTVSKHVLPDGSIECMCSIAANPPRVFHMFCPENVLNEDGGA